MILKAPSYIPVQFDQPDMDAQVFYSQNSCELRTRVQFFNSSIFVL